MAQGSNALNFYLMPTGNVLDAQIDLIERLKLRLNLQEVSSEEECDFIIAFVTVVSRAGTDIEAVLQTIPASRPVVLAVFHHTFDEGYIAPQSKRFVNREDVFAVDFLFHEDAGLLRGQHNDESLRSLTDHLTSLGASPKVLLGFKQLENVSPHPTRWFRQCSLKQIPVVALFGLIILVVLIVIFIVCFSKL